MHSAFLIVAVILFVLDALLWWVPTATNPPWAGRLQSLGLAFFAASFLVG